MARSYVITWSESKKMFNLEMLEDGQLLGGASMGSLNSGDLIGITFDEEWLKGKDDVSKNGGSQ